MILSSLFPRFRDIGIIWSVLATALFYSTPVLYPLNAVSAKVRDVISLNPLARAPIFAAGAEVGDRSARPRPGAARGRLALLLVPVALYVAIAVVAVWVFNREAPRIAEEL